MDLRTLRTIDEFFGALDQLTTMNRSLLTFNETMCRERITHIQKVLEHLYRWVMIIQAMAEEHVADRPLGEQFRFYFTCTQMRGEEEHAVHHAYDQCVRQLKLDVVPPPTQELLFALLQGRFHLEKWKAMVTDPILCSFPRVKTFIANKRNPLL